MMKTVFKKLEFGSAALVFMITALTSIETGAQTEQNIIFPDVILKKHTGGSIEGEAWDSSELKNKINLILYVAPNQQNEVESLLERIDEQGYPAELFETTLIINTSATWLPNSIIKGKVRSKAEKDTTKLYVLDLDEILLNEWELSEDNPNIILFDEKGRVSFTSKEKINEETEDNLLHQIAMKIEAKIN